MYSSRDKLTPVTRLMSKPKFQWDEHNTKHVIHDHPERGNTVAEVESLFSDEFFLPVPDRISKYGEQEYSGVAVGNEGIEKHVVYVIRNGEFRPVTCRRASRKQRAAYYEIVNEGNSQQPTDGGPSPG